MSHSSHRFDWPHGKGKGVGTCRYCGTTLRFVARGSRGGAKREWTTPHGTVHHEGPGYCDGEPPCSLAAAVAPATTATSSVGPGSTSTACSLTVDEVVDCVRIAFESCTLPLQRFEKERHLERALWPAMEAATIARGVSIRQRAWPVDCFMPAENRTPDGLAECGNIVIALELKLLRGKRERDGGEFHRGLGQCFAYVCDSRYSAAILLVVHAAPTSRRAKGQRLNTPPAPLVAQTMPPRRVWMFSRWI